MEITTKKKIAVEFDADSSNTVIDIISLVPYAKPGYRTLEQWHEVENLILTNYITSLAQVDAPTFQLEQDESERNLILLDLQWKSPRCHFNLYAEIEGQEKQLLNTTSLISPSPYPYSQIELGDYPLGSNGGLSGNIQDVDYGLLSAPDKIILQGTLVSHYYLEKVKEGNKVTNTISDTASLIIPENALRSGITIYNDSDANVYFDIVNTVSESSYLIKLLPTDYYEFPYGITDDIYGITDSLSPISIQIRKFE